MLTAERTTDTFRWERAVQQGNATVEHSVHGTGITRESKGMIQAIEGQSQTWNKNKRVWLHWNWQKEHQIPKGLREKTWAKKWMTQASKPRNHGFHLVRQTKPNGEIADWRNNIQIREESENQYREHETETWQWRIGRVGKPNLYPPFPWSQINVPLSGAAVRGPHLFIRLLVWSIL